MQPIRTRAFILMAAFAALFAMAVPQLAFAGTSVSQLAAGSDEVIVVEDESEELSADAPAIMCQVHERGGQWLGWVRSGNQAGSSDPIDCIKLKMGSKTSGSIQYQVYSRGTGWRAAVSNSQMTGKKGSKHGIEAVRIALTGKLSSLYDVSYSVKTKSGWQSEKRNGRIAGKAGSGNVICAVKVSLKAKNKSTASSDGLLAVRYRAKLLRSKWQEWQANYAKVGKAKGNVRICNLAMQLDSGVYSGGIAYRVHVKGSGWKSWKANGASTGKYSKIDAVKIKLTGEVAKRYDVVYRANVKGTKWQRRARNGETAGLAGSGKGVRALRVLLVPKSKRNGWMGSGKNWRYYENGSVLKGQWVTTKESPIDMTMGSKSGVHRYWLDSTGKLAVGRIINPKKSRDKKAGFMAYATKHGYIMTETTKMIGKKWYSANAKGVLTKEKGTRAAHIERYVKWGLKIARNNRHGYSQANRWGPDYDCSSFVVSALANTGFRVGNAVWTGNMISELTQYGFRWYTDFSKLKRGDILLVHNSTRQHTEIYIGSGKTVGAHIAETGGIYGKAGDQTGKEICVAPYYSIWEGFLRYVG